MRKWILRALYVLPVLMIGGYVLADYTATQGTVAAFTCQSTKICPGVAIYDITGTTGVAVKAASTAAAATDPSAVVQDAYLALDFGAPGATACASDTASCNLNQQMQRLAQRLSTMVTALGTPFQAGGSIGNTTFGSTHASGSYAAGSLAAGAGVDGWDLTEGAKADSVCGTSTGTCSVVALTKFIAQSVSSAIPLGTANGWTPLKLAALTNTAVAIKASAGQLGKLYCYNPNASVAYIQVYNVASGSVTVGTTAALQSYGIPATSSSGFVMGPVGDQYSTAMAIAATTTAGGGTAPGTAIDCNVSFN